MNWKEQLLKLENNKEWDRAIAYMQYVICEEHYNCDAYISMLYLLMNLLVEEDYDNTKHDYYAGLAKKYFDESYALFHENPKYLFYVGNTAFMSEWYFDITIEEAESIALKSYLLEPNNVLYQSTYYLLLNKKDPKNRQALIDYAQKIVEPNSPIKGMLSHEGSLGKYLLEIIIGSNKQILSDLAVENHGICISN